MTYIELVRKAAAVVGVRHDITDEDADYILFEYTGFPGFYSGPLCLERQLLEFMRAWRDTGKWPRHPLFSEGERQ